MKRGCLKRQPFLLYLKIVFEALQKGDRRRSVLVDPSVIDLADGHDVQVVPSKLSFLLNDYQIGFLQNSQVLHDGASVEVAEVRTEVTGGLWLITKEVENMTTLLIR